MIIDLCVNVDINLVHIFLFSYLYLHFIRVVSSSWRNLFSDSRSHNQSLIDWQFENDRILLRWKERGREREREKASKEVEEKREGERRESKWDRKKNKESEKENFKSQIVIKLANKMQGAANLSGKVATTHIHGKRLCLIDAKNKRPFWRK